MTATTPIFTPTDRPSTQRIRRPRLLLNLRIGSKLTLGFGILVALTLVVIGLSYLGSAQATEKINQTDEVRVPTALVAARAQANLLKMQADVRGYLALGDQEYRDNYRQDAQAFTSDLAELATLAPKLTPEDQGRLTTLRDTYGQWAQYPDKLFDLRNDQLEREPAYAILATQGSRLGGTVLINIGKLIEEQGRRDAQRGKHRPVSRDGQIPGLFQRHGIRLARLRDDPQSHVSGRVRSQPRPEPDRLGQPYARKKGR